MPASRMDLNVTQAPQSGLSTDDLERYRKDGFIVVPDILRADEVAELRAVTGELVDAARSIAANNDVYDLEDTHTSHEPRVRRIKRPHIVHPAYARLVRHAKIVAVLRDLWGPNIRFDTSKLNLKAAGYGAAVEWHQDWAFYPHTHDDLAAVGILFDDAELENGPLMVIPGSHRGPVYDHHAGGVFVGAIDPQVSGIDFSRAVPLTGKAGSITVHHVRAVHGSAPNLSAKDRRLLLFQFRAADAWPLLGFPDLAQYDELMVSGETTIEPRVERVPVRLPLPPPENQGSIYENQRGMRTRFFK